MNFCHLRYYENILSTNVATKFCIIVNSQWNIYNLYTIRKIIAGGLLQSWLCNLYVKSNNCNPIQFSIHNRDSWVTLNVCLQCVHVHAYLSDTEQRVYACVYACV